MILKTFGAMFLVLAVCFVPLVLGFVRSGISTQRAPSRIEAIVARNLRHASIPLVERHRMNPVRPNEFDRADTTAHWADHCAVCHGADGRGDTAIGENLYPPAPDMRDRDTQSLSDGELFYLIRNGVRFTGMPGWATLPPEEDEASWQLVHLIRMLPELSQGDVDGIEALMPKSAHELEEERRVRAFLSGDSDF